MASLNKVHRSRFLVSGIFVAAALAGVLAVAQDYRMHRGGAARNGRATVQTGVLVAETIWNNAGRAFLRWWDPSQTSVKVHDNGPSAETVAVGTCDPKPSSPVPPHPLLAGSFVQPDPTTVPTPYFFAKSIKGTSTTDPTAGATATYTWTLSGLDNALDYEVDLNVPVGPTNTDPYSVSSATNTLYQQRYWVVRVADNTGNTTTILDSFQGGGFMGVLGPQKNKFYRPISDGATGHVTVTLYNTCPLNSQGTTLDDKAVPGSELVYADAVSTAVKATASGAYTASPVVGQLENVSPVTSTTDVWPQRVVHARTDSALIGAINTRYNIGLVTSSVANGLTAYAGETARKNRVWSYPAKAPLDSDSTDRARYLLDLGTWIAGPNTDDSRQYVRRVVDDLNSSTSTGGTGFVSSSATTGFIGGDYLLAPVQPAVTSSVTFSAAKFPDGNYFIDVYVPTGFLTTDLSVGATYIVKQGALVVKTFTLDQAHNRGWQRLSSDRFIHSSTAPLTVSVQDTKAGADAGTESIVADAARFVTDADWSIPSTPVMVSTSINDAGSTATRDVVVIASETGRLTCMDAHGDPTTGAPPKVYWTYPSEVSATDPNKAITEDGGGQEDPVSFDISSAMVRTVAGVDLLTIGASNGRVYCLELVGRGDNSGSTPGTTKRRWTYPDDFRPDAPTTAQVPSALGAIKGSVVAATIGGNEAVIVATTNGKVIALDATGDATKRTTSVIWEYPSGAATIGSIQQTPTYDAANHRLFFACPAVGSPTLGTVYSLDTDTGLVNWSMTSAGTSFGEFGTASLLYLDNATSTIGDTVYAVDHLGYMYALDASNGSLRWSGQEAGPGTDAGLSFVYLRTYDVSHVLVASVPTVLVATTDGQLLGFYADGTVNTQSTHLDWNSYTLKGNHQKSGFAVGGFPNTVASQHSHIYIGDSIGDILAFSSEDDTNSIPPYSNGDSPVFEQVSDNDPSAAVMAFFKDKDLYQYYSPDDYNTVFAKAIDPGVLTASDFTGLVNFNPAVTSPDPKARDHFELGETLYFVLKDLPGPTATVAGQTMGEYSCSLVSGAAESNNLREHNLAHYDYDTDKRAFFAQVPFVPGANGFGPGDQIVTFRFTRIGSQASVTWPVRVNIANPFAIQFAKPTSAAGFVSSAGYTTNPADATVQGNNPIGLDSTAPNFSGSSVIGGPTDRFLKSAYGAADNQEAGGYLGPDVSTAGSPLTHGQIGRTEMLVYDRSLVALVFGAGRGLGGVRTTTGDLTWQPATAPTGWAADNTDPSLPVTVDPETDLGVLKPLNTGSNKATWLYRKFEDYPWSRPNISRDYPDVSRGNLTVTRSSSGDSQNPLVQPVDLEAPIFASTDLTHYNGSAVGGYGSGLTRSLTATPFEIALNVPKYQPSNSLDYRSRQKLYLEDVTGSNNTYQAARTFALGATVAADEKLVTKTPTLDLGALAGGTGFNGNGWADAPFIHRAEYTGQPDAASDLSPSKPGYASGANKIFGSMGVYNDGNVNMLDVRVAKAFSKNTVGGPVRRSLDLYSQGSHELAWLDAQYNLFTDLDPAFSIPSLLAANAPIPAQKPRPQDPAPSRMSRNPVFRSNGNLGVGSGKLVDDSVAPALDLSTGDIRVGVAVPVGTPAGTYQRPIFAFEDTGSPAGVEGAYPTLGPDARNTSVYEPYVETGTLLKFSITESRLTNSTRPKTAINVDNLLGGTEQYAWNNSQPTSFRGDTGQVYVAWTSNRRNISTGLPDFNPITRLEADMQVKDMSRIYLASLHGGVPIAGALAADQDHSPLSDLNLTQPWLTTSGSTTTDSRWFQRITSFPDLTLTTPEAFFGVGAGETIVTGTGAEGTIFHSPAFPSSTLADPLAAPTAPRSSQTTPFVAFLGDAVKTVPGGSTKPVHQVFLGQFNTSSNAVGGYMALSGDTDSVKSRPTVAQRGSDATVFYTQTAVGSSEIVGTYISGAAKTPKRIGLRNQFEDVGAPNAIWRRTNDAQANLTAGTVNTGLIDLLFTGKVRGRTTSEAYLTRIDPDSFGQTSDVLPLVPFGQRTDTLSIDTASGTYWSPGLQWSLDASSVSLLRLKFSAGSGGASSDIILPADLTGGTYDPNKAVVDRDAGEIVADAKIVGGKVYIDTRAGTVRFSGATIPSNAQLTITYSPRILRVGSNSNANYRHVSAVFDERFLGVHAAAQADEQLLGDLAGVFDETNIAVTNPNAAVRYDRLWVATDQTSRTGKERTRPHISVWQYGIQLPYPVFVSTTGVMTVTVASASTGYTYQVDPIARQISFPVDLEGVSVQYHYTAVRPDGTTFRYPATGEATATVGLIQSRAESAIGIEQAANESDISLSLDPQSSDFNPTDATKRRPPLLWMFWTSTRGGVPDVYFQTIAPRITATPGS